jgi:hypothetical protein
VDNFSSFALRFHGARDGDPVGAGQETQILMVKGELNGQTPRAFCAMFSGYAGEHTKKAVFDVGNG